MNIRQKMLLGAVALTLIPVALTSLLLWQGASTLSAETVGGQVRTQLVSLRDTSTQSPIRVGIASPKRMRIGTGSFLK